MYFQQIGVEKLLNIVFPFYSFLEIQWSLHTTKKGRVPSTLEKTALIIPSSKKIFWSLSIIGCPREFTN